MEAWLYYVCRLGNPLYAVCWCLALFGDNSRHDWYRFVHQVLHYGTICCRVTHTSRTVTCVGIVTQRNVLKPQVLRLLYMRSHTWSFLLSNFMPSNSAHTLMWIMCITIPMYLAVHCSKMANEYLTVVLMSFWYFGRTLHQFEAEQWVLDTYVSFHYYVLQYTYYKETGLQVKWLFSDVAASHVCSRIDHRWYMINDQ